MGGVAQQARGGHCQTDGDTPTDLDHGERETYVRRRCEARVEVLRLYEDGPNMIPLIRFACCLKCCVVTMALVIECNKN